MPQQSDIPYVHLHMTDEQATVLSDALAEYINKHRDEAPETWDVRIAEALFMEAQGQLPDRSDDR